MNMVICVLTDTKFLATFWPEAVEWTSHISNRSPTSVNNGKTPQELWTGKLSSVEHFRVFGCTGYVHIHDNKRNKFDDKSAKCHFLDISQKSKAYKLYNPQTKKVVTSRDVVFNEQEGWNWESSSQPVLTKIFWDGDEDVWLDSDDDEGVAVKNPVVDPTAP